jgi:GT2 family glycosyltransferase
MPDFQMTAIVSSFNRLTLLQSGLPSLYEALSQCPFSASIVVFDAGSTDGSQQWLEDYRRQNQKVAIDVIAPDPGDDTSFSAGVNTACRYAANKYPGLNYYLFFETDNWIQDKEPIVTAAALLQSEDKLAAVGFTVRKYSGADAGYGCSFPTAGQLLLGQHLTCIFRLDAPRCNWQTFGNIRWTTCDVVFTSPIVVRRIAWEQSHGFDQQTFPFSDCDTDWCWRLTRLGWRLAVLETNVVVHDNRQQISQWSNTRAVQFHRARLRLLAGQLGGWVYLLKPLLLIRHCLEYVLALVLVIIGKRPNAVLESRKRLIVSVLGNYS